MARHRRRPGITAVLAAVALALTPHGQGWAADVGALRRAANQGDAEAQYRLADAYANGQGVAQNVPEAIKWYRKAAEQGLGKAQFAMGALCASGEGVSRDPVQGLMWLTLAAERGVDGAAEVRDEFARRLSAAEVARAKKLAAERRQGAKRGEGLEASDRGASAAASGQALKGLRDAAERGDPNAQFYLGIAYLGGKPSQIVRDEVEGLMWLELAGASGGGYAQAYRDTASRAAPANVAEAARRARGWKAKR